MENEQKPTNHSRKIKLPSQKEIRIRHVIFKNMKGDYHRGRIVKIIEYIGACSSKISVLYPSKQSPIEPDKNVCKICMDAIPAGKRALIWCFHPFCQDCLYHWYVLKNECPTCRAPFCISCGANPKLNIDDDNACRCPLRVEHKNARTCNFCGEWAPSHGPDSNCPQFRRIARLVIPARIIFNNIESPPVDDDLPELE